MVTWLSTSSHQRSVPANPDFHARLRQWAVCLHEAQAEDKPHHHTACKLGQEAPGGTWWKLIKCQRRPAMVGRQNDSEAGVTHGGLLCWPRLEAQQGLWTSKPWRFSTRWRRSRKARTSWQRRKLGRLAHLATRTLAYPPSEERNKKILAYRKGPRCSPPFARLCRSPNLRNLQYDSVHHLLLQCCIPL